MIVFKQSFKPRSSPSTPGLNVRHLQYIATRPGAIRNQGCGFGLWGQTAGAALPKEITDFNEAKRQLREVSRRRTVYRAIVSMEGKEAAEKGYYDRKNWERLIGNHVSVIAKEMGIRPENFCWMASMHYAKGHPHVHLVYWDNGTDPRPEFISKERFDIMAERVRADFGREVYREELKEAQGLQRSEIQQLRTELRAMCREANPEAALNLQKLEKSPVTEQLAAGLAEIVRQLPARGSLDYKYLPPACKALVDDLVDRCLELPELNRQWEKYRKTTGQISNLYGNGGETAARNLNKAESKLRKELGNEVMKAVRALTRDLQADHPVNRPALMKQLHTTAATVAKANPGYQALLTAMPPERIPWSQMEAQVPGWGEGLDQIVEETAGDWRIRFQVRGYVEGEIQATGAEPGSVEAKELSREIYRDVYRELRREVTEGLRGDAGWNGEAAHTAALGMLCGMTRCASQIASQQEAHMCQAKLNTKWRSKDKSKEAKKDYRATQAQAGDWEPD